MSMELESLMFYIALIRDCLGVEKDEMLSKSAEASRYLTDEVGSMPAVFFRRGLRMRDFGTIPVNP